MSDVSTREEYGALFANGEEPERRHEKALQWALDTRKFEIELYWKRATYFWTLIVVALGAFFALSSDEPRNEEAFLIACVGLNLSVAWYLVNRGSKYWQENWERHVDLLEDGVIGPLFKTSLATTEFEIRKLHRGFPYSVSKINQLTSLFVSLVWVALAAASYPGPGAQDVPRDFSVVVLGIGTVVFIGALLRYGRSDPRRCGPDVAFTVAKRRSG